MKNKLLFSILLLVVFNYSCHPDDPNHVHEEELITSVSLKLTPQSGGSAVTFSYVDSDGNGGKAPIITGGTLTKDVIYNGEITLKNESVSPVIDVTKEIRNEGTDHQLFYSDDFGGLEVKYTDKDSKGKPIGLTTQIKAIKAGKGNLKVILKHEPNKKGAGVEAGDIKNAGGETDIEVSFPLEIK